MSEITYTAGAFLSVKESDDGVYEVAQLPHEVQLPKIVQGVEDDRIEIDWSFGVGKITGYFIKSTFEIGVEVHIIGIKIGSFYGNLKDGLVIKIDLFAEKGEIRLYLKNGNEAWVSVNLSGLKDYHTDIKLFSF